jgi:hypothetical protein
MLLGQPDQIPTQPPFNRLTQRAQQSGGDGCPEDAHLGLSFSGGKLGGRVGLPSRPYGLMGRAYHTHTDIMRQRCGRDSEVASCWRHSIMRRMESADMAA